MSATANASDTTVASTNGIRESVKYVFTICADFVNRKVSKKIPISGSPTLFFDIVLPSR